MGKLCERTRKCLLLTIAHVILIVQECYGQHHSEAICCEDIVEAKPYKWLMANQSQWQSLTIMERTPDGTALAVIVGTVDDENAATATGTPCQMATTNDLTPNVHRIALLRCENTTLDLVSILYKSYIFVDESRNSEEPKGNDNSRTSNDGRGKNRSLKIDDLYHKDQNGQHNINISPNSMYIEQRVSFNAIHLSRIPFARAISRGRSNNNRRKSIAKNNFAELINLNENNTEYLSWIKSNLTGAEIESLIELNYQLFFNMTILQLADNQINSLSKLFMSKLPNLVSLNLSGNNIDNELLDKHLFGDSMKLTQLDLSRNKLKSILVQNATMISEDYAMGNYESRMSSSNSYMEWNIFGSQLKLEYLDLSENLIADLPRNAFEGLHSLRCLNLAYNRLVITPFQAFHALSKVEHMNLAHNKLVSVLDNFFFGNRELRVLQLQHNSIERLTQYSLHGLENLQHLDVAHNQLLSIDRNAFDSLRSLRTLNLSGNKFKSISTTLFAALKDLIQLDLSANHFVTLPNGVFASQYKLERLTIDNTTMEKLGNLISRQAAVVDKTVLSRLRYVSITNNMHLHEIEPITIRNMAAVESLNLSGNHLNTLPVEFGELKQLKELDISRNDLIFIPKQLNELKYLHSLNLLGNNYACDCHMHWLTNWMTDLRETIGNRTGEIVTNSPPLNQLHQLKCRHGYPGDMMRVLQHLHCAKPHVEHVSDSRMHLLRSEAQLECKFLGNPAPDIIWVTPTNKIIRHNADPDTKPTYIHNPTSHNSEQDGGRRIDMQGSYMPGALDYHKFQANSNKFSFDEQVMGFSLLENGTLRIHNVSRKDSGLYTCYGHNIMGYSTANIR